MRNFRDLWDILRDLWDNTKYMIIHIIGIPEGEEKEQGTENLSEEILATRGQGGRDKLGDWE